MSGAPDVKRAPGLPVQRSSAGLTDHGPRTSDTLLTTAGRLTAWAEWFGLEPPPMRRCRPKASGEVWMDDLLLQWMIASGGSIDWFVSGDLRGMAASHRKEVLGTREFIEDTRRLSEDRLELLKATMVLIAQKEIAAEDVTAAFEAGLSELEAKQASQSTYLAKGDRPGDEKVVSPDV